MLNELNGTAIGTPKTYTATAGSTAGDIASHLVPGLNGISGFVAVASTATGQLTVTRPGDNDFLVTVTMTPAGALATTATTARVVTVPLLLAGATYTLTVAGIPYTSSSSDATSNDVASDLASQVNQATGFAATAVFDKIYILATTTTAFDATLAQNAVTFAYQVGGTPQVGDILTLSFASGGGNFGAAVTPALTAQTAASTQSAAQALANAVNSVTGMVAVAISDVVEVSRLAGAFVGTPSVSRSDSTTPTTTIHAVAVTQSVESLPVPAAAASDSWTLSLVDGSGQLGSFSEPYSADQTAGQAAAQLATDLGTNISGFTATATAAGLLIVRRTASTAGFGISLALPASEAPTQAATVLMPAGPIVANESWQAALTPAGGTRQAAAFSAATTVPIDIVNGLQPSLAANATSFVVLASANGIAVTLRSATTGYAVSTTVVAAGTAAVSAAATDGITFTGPANQNDDWQLTVAGTTLHGVVQTSSAGIAGIAQQLLTAVRQAGGLSGYTAFVDGPTLYVTSLTSGAAFSASLSVVRNANAGFVSVDGTARLLWDGAVALRPAGPSQVQGGDVWTVNVNGTDYQVTASSSQEPLYQIVDALVSKLSAYGASRDTSTNAILLSAGDGSPLTILPISQFRPAAFTTGTSTTDARAHDYKAVFTLAGDASTGGWSQGEIWTVTVDGTPYSFTVPVEPDQTKRTLTAIATGLVAAINKTTDPIVASSNGAIITITDKDYSNGTGSDPFVLDVSRGSGSVTGVFNASG
ncbi:MAG TPA: hypothetical protein VIC62_11330, partial [Nakamurella sp.]